MNDILHALSPDAVVDYDSAKHGDLRKSGAGRQESSTTRAVRQLLRSADFGVAKTVAVAYRSDDGKKIAGTFRRLAPDMGLAVSLAETQNGLTVFTVRQRDSESTPEVPASEDSTSTTQQSSTRKTAK